SAGAVIASTTSASSTSTVFATCPARATPPRFVEATTSMNIYENDVEPDDEPAYLGCYSDPADNRVFVQEAASDDMSAEAICLGHCSAYQYYGTQCSTDV
ncbi:unnamed protein product, partial [Ectocarpus sp. 13 AM-2016]